AVGNDLYAAGWFTLIGGTRATNLAKWNGTAWSVVGNGPPFTATALSTFKNNLYIGGGHNARDKGGDTLAILGACPLYINKMAVSEHFVFASNGDEIWRWDGANWVKLFDLQNVSCMVTVGDDLYMGDGYGGFGTLHHIARWDGTNLTALGSGVD